MIIAKLGNIELLYKPREDGQSRYFIELHDFDNLDGYQGVVEYDSLEAILANPNKWRSLIY